MVNSHGDSAAKLPCRVKQGVENPIEDQLNRFNEGLQTDWEKSRFFTRTVPIHDPQ
jgi:hypothetical protein